MLTYISIIFICKFLGIRLGKMETFADRQFLLIKARLRNVQKVFIQPATENKLLLNPVEKN